MAFVGLTITDKGREALMKAQIDGKLEITRFGIGDGRYADFLEQAEKMVHRLFYIEALKINRQGDFCVIEADLTNEGLTSGYYFREFAIYAKLDGEEILYAYDNAGNEAEYIPPNEYAMSVEKRLRISLQVSGVKEIEVTAASVLYLPQQDFERHQVSDDHDYRYYLKEEVDEAIDSLSKTFVSREEPERWKENDWWYRTVDGAVGAAGAAAETAVLESDQKKDRKEPENV